MGRGGVRRGETPRVWRGAVPWRALRTFILAIWERIDARASVLREGN